MALPVLGLAARLILTRGFKEAVKKYGKTAAAKGKKQIKKREEAIEKRATKSDLDTLSPAEKRASYSSPRQAQKSRDTLKDKARQRRITEEQKKTAGKERTRYIEELEEFDLIEEVPLKFAEGGEVNKGIEALRKEAPEVVARMGYQEGGDIDAQMAMMMPTEEAPMPIEQEQDMMPDEQMEDEYLDFIIDQSLSPEEETSLMSKLEADPELSVMFDKVMDTATEFAGAGPVEGPGSGVSDSIPARLSDGEFVFTAKATEQIGADRLQSMMEDAEMEADAMRQEMQKGGAVEEEPQVDRFGKPVDEDIAEDEIRKGMMSVNPRLQ